MVAIGNRILKIDTTKVGKAELFTAEEPLKCPMDKLIDGIQIVGKHDAVVTDLSMCQWMTSRLASASVDGTVCIVLYSRIWSCICGILVFFVVSLLALHSFRDLWILKEEIFCQF